MLGKLFKDEMKSYAFPMGIIFLTGLVFTVFMKALCMLPYPSESKDVIQLLGFYAHYYIILLIGTAAYILSIVRFYTTMVADRGYLTWTLPVASHTHIWVKLISGLIWRALAGIAVMAFIFLFVVGNYWSVDFQEIFDVFEYVLTDMWQDINFTYLPSIFMFLIGILLWMVVPILFVYLCIAIGQLFGKWRILASIGTYFVSILVLEALSVMCIVFVIVGLEPIGMFFEHLFTNFAPVVGVTLISVFFALLPLGLSAIFFIITNNIFKNHLNLE